MHKQQLYKIVFFKDQNYDFMDNIDLVKAVVDVRLNSDVGAASSLVGALSNLTNKSNLEVHNRMLSTMQHQLGYCRTCAHKTIEYYCTPVHE